MKNIQLIILFLLVGFLRVYAVEYVKKENGIILIGSKTAPFQQNISFDLSMELYSDGNNKQHVIKISIPLEKFYSFGSNSAIVFTLKSGEILKLKSLYHFYASENSNACFPVSEEEIEMIINGITSLKFDLLEYTGEGIIDTAIEEQYRKSGWEKEPTAFRMRNYNIIKQIENFYDDVNKEYEKLKKRNFVIK